MTLISQPSPASTPSNDITSPAMAVACDRVERARREQVRRRAAQLFVRARSAVEVAVMLEVSTRSAYQWRRA